MTMMKRMWVNQPSTQQRYHHLHGELVYANPLSYVANVRIYMIHGSIISQIVSSDALEKGWPLNLQFEKGVAF